MKHQYTWLDAFLSLNWYEVLLRFLFTFVAKTSEVMLAAGLVVSTASFLTDGSILANHPGVSVAWAWTQALAIDSSLGVSLSYTFQYLQQREWIRGALYGLLTLLLSGVAGAITTIDIVSHALHLSMNDAMAQIAINVTLLSRLRAVAVIGFILMSRLRDLPITTPLTKAELHSSANTPSGSPEESLVQATVQSLCRQFNTQEMVQILNTCIANKKLVLTRIAPKGMAKHSALLEDSQQNTPEPAANSDKTEEPYGAPAPRVLSEVPEQSSSVEPFIQEPQVPKPIVEDHLHKFILDQETAREPQKEAVVSSASEEGASQKRMEQAYQLLLAEGKKPSGRALAERAHVHRSTCVQWLKARKVQFGENGPVPALSEHNETSEPVEPREIALMDKEGNLLERDTVSDQIEMSQTELKEWANMNLNSDGTTHNGQSGVFSDSSLPEDALDS